MASNDIVELPSNFREAPSDLNDVTELHYWNCVDCTEVLKKILFMRPCGLIG